MWFVSLEVIIMWLSLVVQQQKIIRMKCVFMLSLLTHIWLQNSLGEPYWPLSVEYWTWVSSRTSPSGYHLSFWTWRTSKSFGGSPTIQQSGGAWIFVILAYYWSYVSRRPWWRSRSCSRCKMVRNCRKRRWSVFSKRLRRMVGVLKKLNHGIIMVSQFSWTGLSRGHEKSRESI